MFLTRKQVLLPIIEFLIGVFIGSVLFALGEFLHDKGKKCFKNIGIPNFGKGRVLHQKFEEDLHNNKFMFIGMRSTHNLIRKRGIAGLETWANNVIEDPKSPVEIEIFAESNLELDNVKIIALDDVLRGFLIIANFCQKL